MLKDQEVYVSTDVEADGPIPGPHSMLSFASVAYLSDKTVLSTFSANLHTLPGATQDARTMDWWKGFPEAWAECRREPRDPAQAMAEYVKWLQGLPGRVIFLGWPANWDFMWIYWYLVRYTGERPFRENALDIRSYAMGMRKSTYQKTSRTYLPKRWFDERPHTHVALEDALEQGALFCNMVAENLQPPETPSE
jgi:hypothetical protein